MGSLVQALTLALCFAGCTRTSEAGAEVVRGALAVPAAADHGAPCLDVSTTRACWDAARRDDATCTAGRCVVPRDSHPLAADASALRCSGQGEARSCVDRGLHAGRFACAAARCVQRQPRAPDNGEWDCAELDGVSLCLRVSDGAGIPDGPTEPGYVCGIRRGSGERLCVDFAPDVPPGPARWSCHVSHAEGGTARVCTPTEKPQVGGVCSSDGACPRDALCAGGVCLPPRPEPSCWLDADCGAAARCRWGSCVAGR